MSEKKLTTAELLALALKKIEMLDAKVTELKKDNKYYGIGWGGQKK